MNSNRKIAIIVGVLYIIATVAGILSVVFLGPILDGPDYLINVFENENKVRVGALFEFIMAVAVAGIPIIIYPILKKYNEGLALWHVGARIFEGVIGIVCAISLLTLLTLSQEFVKAGAPDASCFQTSGTLLIAVRGCFPVFGTLVFAIGALIFNYLLYQLKLIPRFLPVWGIIGAILLFPAGILALYGHYPSTIDTILWIPTGVYEMVLAVWLIVKGFNSSAINSLSTKQI